MTGQAICIIVYQGGHLRKKIRGGVFLYSACTESWANVCFITGKMQREREARTGPPAATPAGIRAIRERGRNEDEG